MSESMWEQPAALVSAESAVRDDAYAVASVGGLEAFTGAARSEVDLANRIALVAPGVRAVAADHLRTAWREHQASREAAQKTADLMDDLETKSDSELQAIIDEVDAKDMWGTPGDEYAERAVEILTRRGVRRTAKLIATADLGNPPLCSDHFENAYGYDPDMGDEGSTFEPGVCSVCGRDGVVFSLSDDGLLAQGSRRTADADSDAETRAWYKERENVTYTDGSPVEDGDRIRFHQAPGGLMSPGDWRYGVAVTRPMDRYDDVNETLMRGEDGLHYNLYGHVIERAPEGRTASKGDGFSVEKRGDKWVVTDDNGNTKGTHDSREKAEAQQSAAYANWAKGKRSGAVLTANLRESAAAIEALEAFEASGHDLLHYENRSTPDVVPEGSKGDPDDSWGRQTKREHADPDEEKQIANGEWVRKSEDGSKSDGTGSKIRPQFNKGSSMTPGVTEGDRVRAQAALRRRAINEDAFGSERYQEQPSLPPEWATDEWTARQPEQDALEGRSLVEGDTVTIGDTRQFGASRTTAEQDAQGGGWVLMPGAWGDHMNVDLHPAVAMVGRNPDSDGNYLWSVGHGPTGDLVSQGWAGSEALAKDAAVSAAKQHRDAQGTTTASRVLAYDTPGVVVPNRAGDDLDAIRPPGDAHSRIPPAATPAKTHVQPSTVDRDGSETRLTEPAMDYSKPTFAQQVAAKVANISHRVIEDNPHLSMEQARAIALRVVGGHPGVVGTGSVEEEGR